MRLRTALLGLFTISALVAAAPNAAPNALTPERHQQYLASFEQVWSTVRDRYWDPELTGLDWQKVHDELRPRMEKASSSEEARKVLSNMLASLNQSHFAILPAALYSDLQGSPEGHPEARHDGTSGLDLRVLNGHAIVTRVEANSPAAEQGVKPGWEVLAVNGKPCQPTLERIITNLKNTTSLDLIASRVVLSTLDGAQGSSVDVQFQAGSGSPVTLKLNRVMPKGHPVTFMNLPPMPFWAESRTLPGDVGYIQFNAWFEPETIQSAFQETLKDPAHLKGCIIDLRGNPGGIAGMAMGAAGWFVDEPGRKLGVMQMRGTAVKFVVFPRPASFSGPLAILVDGCSASTSEFYAGGMQDLKRARIFGTRTAGMALPSICERLPSGDGFQYAIAKYTSEGGHPLEGRGVIPDEEVRLTPSELLTGKDPVLDRALAWIRTQTPKP